MVSTTLENEPVSVLTGLDQHEMEWLLMCSENVLEEKTILFPINCHLISISEWKLFLHQIDGCIYRHIIYILKEKGQRWSVLLQSPTKNWYKTQPAVSANTVCPALQFFKGRISLADHHHSLLEGMMPGPLPCRPWSQEVRLGLRAGQRALTGTGRNSRHPWGPGRSGEDQIIRDTHRCQLVHGGGIDCNHNPPGMTIGILTGHRAAPSVPKNQVPHSEQRKELN